MSSTVEKYVLVTGGSKGIGKGIVSRAFEDGYKPIVLDLSEPEVDCIFKKVDLSDSIATAETLKEICNQYKILRLVNNVGVVAPKGVETTTPSDIELLMKVNVQPALQCLNAVLPFMKQEKFGRIVSITSRAMLGKVDRTAYSATKGALASMTKTWSLELGASGITVNSVAPGPIGTEAFYANNPKGESTYKNIVDKIPLQKIGTAEDVAHAVSYFLDERSGFVTGQNLYVCGGMTVGMGT